MQIILLILMFWCSRRLVGIVFSISLLFYIFYIDLFAGIVSSFLLGIGEYVSVRNVSGVRTLDWMLLVF